MTDTAVLIIPAPDVPPMMKDTEAPTGPSSQDSDSQDGKTDKTQK